MHMCFKIDDLPAYVAQLRERGIEVSEPTRGSDHNLQAWVHDPDGNAIELMQIDPSSPQAKWEIRRARQKPGRPWTNPFSPTVRSRGSSGR